MKRRFFITVIVMLCIVLQACGPTGPAVYTLGTTWETEGNRVSVQKSAVTDSYITAAGEEIEASPACSLLVVTCEIALAEGFSVGDCRVSKNEAGSKSYSMYSEPIPLESDIQTFALIFNIPSSEVAEDAMDDLQLDISLEDQGYRHTGTFMLK